MVTHRAFESGVDSTSIWSCKGQLIETAVTRGTAQHTWSRSLTRRALEDLHPHSKSFFSAREFFILAFFVIWYILAGPCADIDSAKLLALLSLSHPTNLQDKHDDIETYERCSDS